MANAGEAREGGKGTLDRDDGECMIDQGGRELESSGILLRLVSRTRYFGAHTKLSREMIPLQ